MAAEGTAWSEADLRWMARALELAREAEAAGEVPVGAVVVRDGRLLGEGYNRPIAACDPSAHAEMEALRGAARAVGNYRLPGSTLYVTLEPCPMCAGALLHARVHRLVYGAPDPKTGACGGVFPLLQDPRHLHRVRVAGGLMAEPCGRLLKAFFAGRRAGPAGAEERGREEPYG